MIPLQFIVKELILQGSAMSALYASLWGVFLYLFVSAIPNYVIYYGYFSVNPIELNYYCGYNNNLYGTMFLLFSIHLLF